MTLAKAPAGPFVDEFTGMDAGGEGVADANSEGVAGPGEGGVGRAGKEGGSGWACAELSFPASWISI